VILICSAWDKEIKFLQENSPGPDYLIEPLGIGFLDAALNLQQILNKKKFDHIVFLGTAGSYTRDLDLGEIVSVSAVSLLNFATVLGFGYNPVQYPTFFAERLFLDQKLKPVQCLSGLEITNNENFAQSIVTDYPESGLVENLELFGVAKVADAMQIPWSALLGVTNYIAKDAHQQWHERHQEVSEQLCKAFLEALQQGWSPR